MKGQRAEGRGQSRIELPAALDVSAFVGRPHVDGGCYQIAREVLAGHGVELPESWAAALAEEGAIGRPLAGAEMPRAGDLVLMPGSDGYALHVALCINPFLVLSSEPKGGARTRTLAALRAAGLVVRIVRLHALERGGAFAWA